MKRSYEQRFFDRVCKEKECWEWTGKANASGYGCFYDGRYRKSSAYKPDSVPRGDGHWSKKRPELSRLQPRGERHGMSRLTSEQVFEIRELVKTVSQNKLASRYKVSQSMISLIATRKNWKHIS